MSNFKNFKDMWDNLEQDPEFVAGLLKIEFTDELSIAMESKGLSKADLADRVGCSKAYITKVLRGTTNFTLETMAKLAMAVDHKIHFEMLPAKVEYTIFESVRPLPAAKHSHDRGLGWIPQILPSPEERQRIAS